MNSTSNTYLSIDLDYWFNHIFHDDSSKPDIKSLYKLLDRISHLPTILVDEHHHILDNMNEHKPSKIIHVDYHHDVAFPTKPSYELELNCGTFFWFLNNRKEVDFTWYYPELACKSSTGLCMDEEDKPLSKKNCIFKSQHVRLGLPTVKELSTVTHVGIAASFDYSSTIVNDHLDYIREMFANNAKFIDLLP